MLLTKQTDKRSNGAAEGLSTTEAFWPRLFLVAAIYSLTSTLKNQKTAPFRENSAGMEDGEGRLRKGISET